MTNLHNRAADDLAIFLAARPNVLEKLQDVHQDDGRGYCRVCTVGGQRARLRWPCNIAAAAQHAARIRESGVPR